MIVNVQYHLQDILSSPAVYPNLAKYPQQHKKDRNHTLMIKSTNESIMPSYLGCSIFIYIIHFNNQRISNTFQDME